VRDEVTILKMNRVRIKRYIKLIKATLVRKKFNILFSRASDNKFFVEAQSLLIGHYKALFTDLKLTIDSLFRYLII